jgi:hypothetical protein
MPIIIKCAWCGAVMGSKEGEIQIPLNVTHSICSQCNAGIKPRSYATAGWNGIERRSGTDRRQNERRHKARNLAGTVIVIEGVVWINTQGVDRRNFIRREDDRRMVEVFILKGVEAQ